MWLARISKHSFLGVSRFSRLQLGLAETHISRHDQMVAFAARCLFKKQRVIALPRRERKRVSHSPSCGHGRHGLKYHAVLGRVVI